MKKVLLVSINKCKYPYPVYPLGVSHIAAALIKNGFLVHFCDMGVDPDRLEAIAIEFEPDFVGLSMRNIDDIRIDNPVYFIPELQSTAQRIRAVSNVPVIIGGSAFSLFPERLLELTNADYGIVSEGEVSVVKLLQMLSDSKELTLEQKLSVPGLVYHDTSVVKRNHVCAVEPSAIPNAWRDDTFEAYYRESSGVINVQTQRGCPCKCCYCTYPVIEGAKPRYRPASHIVNEIIESKARGNNYFFIVDSVFNTSKEHVISVCEELLSKNAGISWSCFLKPSNLTEDMIVLMAKAGLKHIEFGSDSFSDTVLSEYRKDFTFDDIIRASEWARIHSVHYAHFLITGGPGESETTLNESFENSKKLKKTVIFPFTGMRLYPDTALYERAISEKVISQTTDLLEPVFYVSPLIRKERIASMLQSFHKQMPNWVIDDAPPEMIDIMKRLRKKGIYGPLWEFLVR